MQITIQLNDLVSALTIATKIVNTQKPSLECLKNVVLIAEHNTLTIMASDGLTAIKKTLHYVNVDESGIIATNATLLLKSLSGLTGSVKIVKESEVELNIREFCGNSERSVLLHSPEEVQELIESVLQMEDFTSIEIESEDLVLLNECLDRVSPFLAKDETKGILQYAYLNGDEICTIDGHRVGLIQSPILLENEMLLSNNVLKALRYFAYDVTVYVNDIKVKVSDDCDVIVSRVLTGKFPNYSQLIPTQFKSNIRLDSKVFMNVMAKLSSIIDSKYPHVKITFDDDIAEVFVKCQDGAEGTELLQIEGFEGEKTEVTLNYHYLISVLKAFNGKGSMKLQDETLTLNFNDPRQPLVFEGQLDERDLRVLILPIVVNC